MDDEELNAESELDLFQEHMLKKEARCVRRERQKHYHEQLRCNLSHGCRHWPAVSPVYKFDEESGEFIPTDRIRRSKRSRMQKWMKKETSHIVRHLPLEELPLKGTHYRKVFDYWWNWV